MEPEITLESHILSLTAAIGTFEDSLDEKGRLQRSYVLGSESIECLRDIKRFLRYDEAKNMKTISNLVGKWEVVQNHLVPIIQYHSENRPIFFAAVELLVPLTWPLRKDQSTSELVHHLRSYKFSIVDSTVINTMFDHLIILLASPNRLLENHDLAMVRLILLFFRNVLAIQDPDSESSHQFSSLHETLVKKLHSIDFLEFCTVAASNINERSFASINTIFIELFYLLLSPTAPILLYDQDLHQYQFSTFDTLVEKESHQRNAPQSKHHRFAANYKYLLEKGMQMNIRSLDFDLDTLNKTKNKPKPPPRKKRVDPLDPSFNIDQSLRDPKKCSASHVRILRDTVTRLIQFGFDPLVSSVKRDIDAESSHVRNEDRIQLMFVVEYCLVFRYMNESDLKLPFNLFSSVLNVHGLLFLLKNIRAAGDTLNVLLLHVSLSCLSTFLQTIKSMLKSENASHQAVANNMLDHLFCDHDQISMFVQMFRTFKTVNWQTLMAMIDTVHHLLSSMELWNSMLGRTSIKVRRRKRKTKKPPEDRDHSSSSESGPEFVNRDVSVNHIEDSFCVDVVVDKYLAALARLDDLSADQVHAVTKMLGRIVISQNQVALLFKLNYLSVIHKVFHNRTVIRLTDPRRTRSSTTLPRGCKHAMETVIPKLSTILRLVINRFFVCYDKYPLMIIDVLFPHTRKDLDRLTSGYAPDNPKTRERTSSTVRRAVKAVQKCVDGDGVLDRFVQALEQLASTRLDIDHQDEMLTSIPPADVNSQEMQTLVETLEMQVLPLTDVNESMAIFGHGLYAVCVPGRLDGQVLTRVVDTITRARSHTSRKRGKGKRSYSSKDTISDLMDDGPRSVPYIFDSDELLNGSDEDAFQEREAFCRKYTMEMYHAVAGDLSAVSPEDVSSCSQSA